MVIPILILLVNLYVQKLKMIQQNFSLLSNTVWAGLKIYIVDLYGSIYYLYQPYFQRLIFFLFWKSLKTNIIYRTPLSCYSRNCFCPWHFYHYLWLSGYHVSWCSSMVTHYQYCWSLWVTMCVTKVGQPMIDNIW